MTTIIYIDDDVSEHKFFQYFLKKSPEKNVNLISVSDIETAITHLKTKKIDLLFLDDRCSPYMSCLETLPKLRPYLQDIKVAVISSSIDASHLRSASTLGVDGVFDKDRVKELLSQGVSKIFKDPSNVDPSNIAKETSNH